MKKTQVALAALALVASTAAMAADVTIGGVMDVGIGRSSGAGGASGVYLENGGYADHSALEIGMSEDLGGGMKAFGSLGMGFNANGQTDDPGVGRTLNAANTGLAVNNNSLFNRQAFVGVSGGFGSLSLGRHLDPFVLSNVLMQNYVGMFGVGRMVLSGPGGASTAFFVNNSIRWQLPEISGYTITAFMTTPNGTRGNQLITDSDTGKLVSYHITGPIGPIAATAAYHKQTDNWSGWNVGGTVPLFDGFTASAGWISNKSEVPGNTQGRVDSWNLGGAYALTGSTSLIIQHAKNNDAGGNQELSNIMVTNALSKRTTLYGGYGWGKNGIGASVGTFGGAVNADGSANAGGPTAQSSNNALVVGVAHSF
jgi:predicted porin